MASLALITGATSGIGAEFARQLAARGDDLILVARDRERLAESAAALAERFHVDVEVIDADLSEDDELADLEARLRQRERPVDLLVNNAGFGLRASFEASRVDDEQRLLDVLVTAPMRLCHAALAQMLPRGRGTIINVASVAGFTPRGSYGAAKAWVLSFSRWANLHYRRHGVTVTALAPGLVRTEFHRRMGVRAATIPGVGWLTAERVVRVALRDAAKGRALSVPSFRYKLAVFATRVIPARWAAVGTLDE
ncbi:SDR family oxidoreductase [Diaminobutyricimonas sp. LJ205]|uniref:SDR family NAD(P)-dependent oxidoreductase n=1 Tax=Diaminobutyricimonas sp. LJ205 TaxID=2683590 RepID=UPI0012F4FBA5|nr:SDR family NAD(P)-dependent oxidoreductase [Diaminobutyricimonas sp. LJ205]